MTLEALSQEAQKNYMLYKAKKISNSEFKELMDDIAIQTKIAETSQDLDRNITCHKIISAIVQLAGLAALGGSFSRL
jgi:hypothetical protein